MSRMRGWTWWITEVRRLLEAEGLDRDFFGFDDLRHLFEGRRTPEDVVRHAKVITDRSTRTGRTA